MDEIEIKKWENHQEDMNKMRNRRRFQFREVIKEFRDLGFEVKEISPFQFRFNESVDIYPSNKRYHDLIKNIRGDIRDKTFGQFLREFFGLN